MKISCVVLTKNEQSNLAKIFKSLLFCDEVLVIDDFSSDDTVKVARKFGAIVYKRKLNADFASQRNFGLKKAKYDWVLFIDADEVVNKKLAQEIIKVIKEEQYEGFLLRRVDFLFGKKMSYGEFGQTYLIRLGRKNSGVWKRKVHEVWEVKGETKKLKNPLYHHPHQSIRDFVSDINYYSSLHAQENLKSNKQSNIFKIIFYPTAKFLNNFILKKGYKDGLPGFIGAILMSFHSFLSWSICFQKQQRT